MVGEQCVSKFLGIERQCWLDSKTVMLVAQFNENCCIDQVLNEFEITPPQELFRYCPKRRAEFIAGRGLVILAQSQLNLPLVPVPIGIDRAPTWPLGQSGSISHKDGIVACILTRKDRQLLGIDVENILDKRALQSVVEETLAPMEQKILAGSNVHPFTTSATIVFSAKETLFKALYPYVKRYFGFESAALTSQPTKNSIKLRLAENLNDHLRAGAEFCIEFEIHTNRVLTWLRIPR